MQQDCNEKTSEDFFVHLTYCALSQGCMFERDVIHVFSLLGRILISVGADVDEWFINEPFPNTISMQFYRQKSERTRNSKKLGDVPKADHRQLHEIFTHVFFISPQSLEPRFHFSRNFLISQFFLSYLTLWRCLYSYLSDFIAQEPQFSFNTGAVKMWKVLRARDDKKNQKKNKQKERKSWKRRITTKLLDENIFPPSFVLMNFKTRNCEH